MATTTKTKKKKKKKLELRPIKEESIKAVSPQACHVPFLSKVFSITYIPTRVKATPSAAAQLHPVFSQPRRWTSADK